MGDVPEGAPPDGVEDPDGPEPGSLAAESALPSELAHLSWLLGTWRGVGLGQYPTIEDFRFAQDITFATDGRPFIRYVSRSWIIDEEGRRIRPSAAETGYLRPLPDNELEWLMVHPSGITEIWIGEVTVTAIEDARITGARIRMVTDGVMRTGTAKQVDAGERLYGLVNGELLWTYDMAAVGEQLTNHLSARLRPEAP